MVETETEVLFASVDKHYIWTFLNAWVKAVRSLI
jgi:hypothetical protein